ncbi:hypothetical protein B0J12DRAFT_641663 [Macrophomina phaseolina]|uniref:Secreted protein n=1 Tax=Macrophomina phaseolina TaxID=35725 RepID=A0ABQ8GUE8_9PEZI|nr:hypothetical protein B0J12DRAFT_641663 [Macrophomina phaseolina]
MRSVSVIAWTLLSYWGQTLHLTARISGEAHTAHERALSLSACRPCDRCNRRRRPFSRPIATWHLCMARPDRASNSAGQAANSLGQIFGASSSCGAA